MSDYIISNDYDMKEKNLAETERLVGLIFDSTPTSPTIDEFAMSVAFNAAVKSACLSRQVGAAIVNSCGDIIASGCNDVPKFKGGLYNSDSSDEDLRCWTRGAKCYNDIEKDEIAKELLCSIKKSELLKDDSQETIEKMGDIISSSRLKEIIEFCRAVHAEMDALLSITSFPL